MCIDPLNKLLLLFLNFIPPAINDFNKLFQTDEASISYLLPDMPLLLRKLMVKFVLMKHVKSKADVRMVEFELAKNQHDDELLAVGVPARTLLTNTDDPNQRDSAGDLL